MSNKYKNLIFTKHALERMGKRSIAKDKIWQVINKADKKTNKGRDNKKYIKEINDRTYHAVATYLKDERKHLVISAWVRGEDDKQSFIWLLITAPFKLIWWILKKLW